MELPFGKGGRIETRGGTTRGQNGAPSSSTGPRAVESPTSSDRLITGFKDPNGEILYINTFAEKLGDAFDPAELVELLIKKALGLSSPLLDLGDVMGKLAARVYVYFADWLAVRNARYIFVTVER